MDKIKLLSHTINGDNMFKSRKYYQEIIKTKHDYKVMLKNFFEAYFFGGLVSLFGQGLFDFYNKILNQNNELSVTYMTLSVITITAILTSFGIYDNLGQVAKCGLSIPISGFANSAVSSSMEYHKEGIVLGIGANTLKLAGSVIVLGTVSALVVSTIRYIFEVLI